MSTARVDRPPWLKVRVRSGHEYDDIRSLLRGLSLHTVCEEAGCPNIAECFAQRTATFLILGDTCTRNCRFCAIHHGQPGPLDRDEPEHVAEAVQRLGLKFAVITSVTRDDLPDGGAQVYADCMAAIRRCVPDCGIEVLIPDFRGSEEALRTVMQAHPDVLNHNVETVPRLYPEVRPQADYARSLRVLRRAKEMAPRSLTKSGIMLGLGEEKEEIIAVMDDLRGVGCELFTIGQYLRPSSEHLPIRRHWSPAEFEELAAIGRRMGFTHIESGPLVRSSYHARLQSDAAREAGCSR